MDRELGSHSLLSVFHVDHGLSMQLAESIEIKILLSIQAASNYNPRKANKTLPQSAALSHYSH